MAKAKASGGRGRPPKKVECKIIVNQMRIKRNKNLYEGNEGDKLSMSKEDYTKLSELGFVK